MLNQPLDAVVAPRIAKQLAEFNLLTVEDLLRYHPRKYADPGRQVAIEQLTVGEYVAVFGTVISAEVLSNMSGGYRLVAVIHDGENQLNLTFFGKSREKVAYRLRELQPGAMGIFTGTVGQYGGALQLTHPDYALVNATQDESELKENASKPIPLYRANAKTPTWVIQKAIAEVLTQLDLAAIVDPIPQTVLDSENLLPLATAFEYLHQPADQAQWEAAQNRFRFEEALVLQTALGKKRLQNVKTTKRRLLPYQPVG